MGRVGHFCPVNELCWCVGSLGMYVLLLVCTGVWLVESMWGSYSCVCWECTLMLGVKNVFWCVGRVINIEF